MRFDESINYGPAVVGASVVVYADGDQPRIVSLGEDGGEAFDDRGGAVVEWDDYVDWVFDSWCWGYCR